jgi:hypothetical protein
LGSIRKPEPSAFATVFLRGRTAQNQLAPPWLLVMQPFGRRCMEHRVNHFSVIDAPIVVLDVDSDRGGSPDRGSALYWGCAKD